MGFDTCWQASATNKAPVRILLGKSAGENAFAEMFFKKGRKPLDSFLVRRERFTPELKEVLEAAILAPSALNRQPWRFEIRSDERLLISVKNPKGVALRYVNLGIVFYHVFAAAREHNPQSRATKISEQVYELLIGRNYVDA